MIASDLNNPDFAGAVNPDGRLAVNFYSRPMQNEFESEKQGRPIFFDVDFVRIQVPGDTTLAIDVPAREDHKQRFPLHWARYQNKKGGDGNEVGTPLEQWPRLSRSQVEELRALKFTTVDQIATASDAQLQRIGMLAGMGPFAFRDHAVRFLKLAHEDAVASGAEEKLKAMEEDRAKDKAEAEEKIKAMEAQINALTAAMAPKKRGRKPKVVSE